MATVASLKSFFDQTNHRPSREMFLALEAVAQTLEAMADGVCPPMIYLSSLDPGVGKTQTIIHFIRALLGSERYRDVGLLLCVSRLEEIEGLVLSMGLDKDQFGVLTSDTRLNGLGCLDPAQGRVLFTTHRMVEVRTEGRRLCDVAALQWRGQPRQVRVWDEAILPGQTLTVTRDDIAFLFKPLRSIHPALTEALEDVFSTLKACADGAHHPVAGFRRRPWL